MRSISSSIRLTIRRLVRLRRKSLRRRWLDPSRKTPKSSQKIVRTHFRIFGPSNSPVKDGLAIALDLLHQEPAKILETGSSAWGADSTRLFAKYVQVFGGNLWSVDNRSEPKKKLGDLGPRVNLEVQDSVKYIEQLGHRYTDMRLNLVYLDSMDVDWANALPAAQHGLREWLGVQDLLAPRAVVVIDDTPRTPDLVPWATPHQIVAIKEFFGKWGLPPGKGTLILRDIQGKKGWNIIHHSYNLVIQKS